jgi:2'-5' RNA ligase
VPENRATLDDRCFLSLKFSPAQQRLLHTYQQPELWPDAKWHSVDNLHLTLVFLGQQAVTAQQELWSKSLELLREHPPVQLCFDLYSQFNQAKILYLGVSKPNPALMALQQQLQQLALPYLHTPVPEHFVPHVTLARKFQSSTLFPQPAPPLELLCTEVALYHSISTELGVSYQSAYTYTLVPKS